jgi:ankyrin repeat protein
MYAAEHWVDHAQFKDVPSGIRDAMEYFFDADKPHFAAWHQVYNMDDLFYPRSGVSHGGPLYYASLCGFYDLAKHLVVKRPEYVNAKGGGAGNPLEAALYVKHLQVAELLYEHGADVRIRDEKEWTPLHWRSRDGSVDAALWLLNHGADANDQTDDGWTPLHLAAWNKQLGIVQMLLEHHADIHIQDTRGEVALHFAVCDYMSHFQVDILQLLMDHGADVNARDNEGSTPLHHSSFKNEDAASGSRKGSVEGTRLLLEHGANIDEENNKGETPFLVALEAEHHEMAEFLWGLGTMFAMS